MVHFYWDTLILISEINHINVYERLFLIFTILLNNNIHHDNHSNYLWTYFEWLLSFPEGLIETDRAKCIFGCNRFNSCFPNEVIMLIMLKSSMMKRKTSQFQACLPLTDTTLCNSPDNINDYKWNEYFVTVKCSAYKSHKRALNRTPRHTDSVDMRLMTQGEWDAVIEGSCVSQTSSERFLCLPEA